MKNDPSNTSRIAMELLYTAARPQPIKSPTNNCKKLSGLINAFEDMNLSEDSKTPAATDPTSTNRQGTPSTHSKGINLSPKACKILAASSDGEDSRKLPKPLVAEQELAVPSCDYAKYCDYVYNPSRCTFLPTYSPCNLIPKNDLPNYLLKWRNVFGLGDDLQKVRMQRRRELDDYLEKHEE